MNQVLQADIAKLPGDLLGRIRTRVFTPEEHHHEPSETTRARSPLLCQDALFVTQHTPGVPVLSRRGVASSLSHPHQTP